MQPLGPWVIGGQLSMSGMHTGATGQPSGPKSCGQGIMSAGQSTGHGCQHFCPLAPITEKRNGELQQALFLSTFSVVFRTLLHASTMSQTIPDIHGSSQIFPVSEGMSF